MQSLTLKARHREPNARGCTATESAARTAGQRVSPAAIALVRVDSAHLPCYAGRAGCDDQSWRWSGRREMQREPEHSWVGQALFDSGGRSDRRYLGGLGVLLHSLVGVATRNAVVVSWSLRASNPELAVRLTPRTGRTG